MERLYDARAPALSAFLRRFAGIQARCIPASYFTCEGNQTTGAVGQTAGERDKKTPSPRHKKLVALL